ncbi:unnamed protein product [Lactuca virosa]|uniref:Uncharacterized protein n=1 Tax=Lactuca virosa TaxID=75947 RepID=A0AAU9LW12_9ASTR|nr:unnamed protein product [Lactuca virosa]
MNFVLQQVLIKIIWSAQRFVDIPNYKFDEVLLIFKETLDVLKKKDPSAEACDNLKKIDGPSDAIGGERKNGRWNWTNEFKLRDEPSEDGDIMKDATNEEEKQIATTEQEHPPFEKFITEEEKAEWLTWPSSLVDSVNKSIQVAKVKTQLKIDVVRATQPKSIPIPPPIIFLIDEGTPI